MAWPTPISETSITQQKTLAIIPKVLAMLSFLGSLYIVVDVCRLPRSKRKVYHRILLGMSVSDCTSSLAWLFTTWPIPPDVLPVWGAKGTQTTCALQGFFTQTSIATVFYSGSLSVYYYLIIRCAWTQSRWEQSKIEWFMHFLAVSFAIGTSTAAVAMGLMNPIGWDCWIASVPIVCNESWLNGGKTDCERGDNANLFQWVFFYIPLWITIFGVTGIMISIIWKFWVQERHNEAWRRKSVGLAASITSNNLESTGGTTPSITMMRRSSHLQRTAATKRRRVEEVVWQSLFYVGGFYFAWIFPTVLRVTEVASDVVYYHWVQLSATFITTQGIINLIVYLRPRYQRIKTHRRRREQQLLHQQHRNSLLVDSGSCSNHMGDGIGANAAAVSRQTALMVDGDEDTDGVSKITTTRDGDILLTTCEDDDVFDDKDDQLDGLDAVMEGDDEDELHQEVAEEGEHDQVDEKHDQESKGDVSPISKMKALHRVAFVADDNNTTQADGVGAHMSLESLGDGEPHHNDDKNRRSRSSRRRRSNDNHNQNRRLFRHKLRRIKSTSFRGSRPSAAVASLSESTPTSTTTTAPSQKQFSWMTNWFEGAFRDMGKALRVGDGGDGGALVSRTSGGGGGSSSSIREDGGAYSSAIIMDAEQNTNGGSMSLAAAAAVVAAAVGEDEEEEEVVVEVAERQQSPSVNSTQLSLDVYQERLHHEPPPSPPPSSTD
ncbi:hypothetical protein ACA910_004316 [Epithemia clementina (nom. ined.)]